MSSSEAFTVAKTKESLASYAEYWYKLGAGDRLSGNIDDLRRSIEEDRKYE